MKTEVAVRVTFAKVGEIDTVKEVFHAEVLIQAKWREPLLDRKTQTVSEKLRRNHKKHLKLLQEIDEIELHTLWSPGIHLQNVRGDVTPDTWHSVGFNKKGEASIVQKWRVRAAFTETMELKQFPFDSQDLTITIATERPQSEVTLNEDADEPSAVNVCSFLNEQEWR